MINRKTVAALLLMTCWFNLGACIDFEVEIDASSISITGHDDSGYKPCLGNAYVLNIVMWWDCLYAPPLHEAGKPDRNQTCSRDSVERMEAAHEGCYLLNEF